MPNEDTTKIILEFPASSVSIELGTTITFDNISGFLSSDRVKVGADTLTEKLSAMDSEIAEKADSDDVYDKTYIDNALTDVNNALNTKADKANTYTKAQVDSALSGKANASDVEQALALKANTADVNNALATKMDKENPVGTGSFSMNRKSGTTVGQNSIAIGTNCTASYKNAHAEGTSTTASDEGSHSEGGLTIASGAFAHAEGYNTQAIQTASHAEGHGTVAVGLWSHAEGYYTEAKGQNQHVSGKYNVVDNNNEYAEIIGNGNSNNRSNARTLDWSGNETLAGDVIINGNQSVSSEISRLDGRIDNLPAPMIFKGTLGVGGTIQTLPTASTSNEGYTYKVITDGTYAGQTAKVGDVFTSNGSAWVYIPSGDEDNDTWRAIKVNGVEKLGNGISSGSLDVVDTDNIEAEFDNDGNKLKLKTKNIYTKTEVDAIVSDAIYNVLPDDTASGAIANFNTSLELPLKSLEVDVNAVQEAGTPTPATPLPISGRSAITLVKCGANLCNQADIVGAYPTKYTVDTDGSIKTVGNLGLADVLWTNKSKVAGVLNVIFVSKYQNTGSVGIRPKIIYTDGTSSVIYTTNTQDYSSKTLLTTSSKTVDKIVVDYGTNNPTNFFLEVTLDTSATAYEPYNGNTEVINLGVTYYGGHFTHNKAGHRQFEVTHRGFVIDSTTPNPLWYDDLKQLYYSGILSDYPAVYVSNYVNYKCDKLKPVAFDYQTQNIGNFISLIGQGTGIGLSIPDCTTQEQAEAFIQNNSVLFVYPLATPYVIDLPDGEPINTFAGVNNFFADTGDTSVVFKDSVNGYVEKKIASVQALILG